LGNRRRVLVAEGKGWESERGTPTKRGRRRGTTKHRATSVVCPGDRAFRQGSVAADVARATGAPFAPKVHYLLPHTHTLATGFTVEILGGPSDGQSLLDLGEYNGEAHGRAFDPPVDMSGSDGFRFACQYTNPRGASVGWGFGDQEMCELFGFADAPAFFQSRVNATTATGTDGPVQLSSGPCTTEVFPATK
jgi:hypothetical protein